MNGVQHRAQTEQLLCAALSIDGDVMLLIARIHVFNKKYDYSTDRDRSCITF